MTTTQITEIRFDLEDYAGEFIADFDMAAVERDYVAAINELVPAGVVVANNGMVFADVDVVDEARDIDWDELCQGVDVEAIFVRHDQSIDHLRLITKATGTVELAEQHRVSAVKAAKDSGRFTVDQIAKAAGVTRDGVYKMLARATP